MVSPLQTWKYAEPRRLWPLLGGLSVLAHVGVLGLSLPYVLELMEPAGDASSVSTPIEMVVVDPEKPVQKSAAPPQETAAQKSDTPSAPQTPERSEGAANSSQPPQSVPPTEAAANNSRPSAITSGATSAQTPASARPSSSSQDNPRTRSQAPRPEEPPAARSPSVPDRPPAVNDMGRQEATRPSARSPDDTSPQQNESSGSDDVDALPGQNSSDSEGEPSPVPSPEASPSEASSPVTSSQSEQPSQAQAPVTDEPEAPADSELPVLDEGEPLAAPEAGSADDQVASLRILNTEVDVVQDVKDEPPRLVGGNDAIDLQPKGLGCGQVNFAQGAMTYRLAINADNSLLTVTPLTASASADAVACLIQSAGFEFEAAKFDGTPVLDDSLVITVDVMESPLGGPGG